MHYSRIPSTAWNAALTPTLKKALYAAAALWILIGTACYTYAFTRDFYAANKRAIHALLGRMGL